MGANIRIAMSAFSDFGKWLWSDWGKPNFLTRVGIPRIATNLLAWLVWFYLCFLLTIRYVPAADRVAVRQKFRLALHNPFFLMAYASLYLCFLVREFLSSKYNVRGRALDKSIRENWSDPFVKVYWVGGACMLLLFLIGALYYRFQLK
jgi:hypothetical protein